MMHKKNRFSSVAGRPLLTVALLLGGAGFVTPARAATFTVLNTLDDGSVGSLRWAVGQANSTPGADTVDFDSTAFSTPQTITLTSGLSLSDMTRTTVTGPAAGVTISGNNASRVFAINVGGGSAALSGLTITGGKVNGPGGGFYNGGTLTVTNCTIPGNSAVNGGGIQNLGTLTVTNSTISGNSTTDLGGGIYNAFDTTATVTNCTISGNSTRSSGGGILNVGPATVTNGTISGNSAGYAGGIFNNGTATLRNTLVANSTSGGECIDNGIFDADTYSIDSDGSCGGATTKTSAQINLGPLASNGGPTWTMALGAGSAAIGAGNNAYATGLLYDQRGLGFDRISGGTVDVGAFEVQMYDFAGFFQPVDNLPTLNLVKAGQGVPVKFSLGGDQGLDILASGSPTSWQIACDGSAPVDAIETVTLGNSGLSYNALTDTYTYVWKTNKAWAGTCRQLRVTLADGTVHAANFQLK